MKLEFKNKWIGKTALITGASSGIGEATAYKLAAKGMRVLLVARRVERLEQIVAKIKQDGGHAEVIKTDLSRERQRQNLFKKVTTKFGNLDILINNAGLGWYGYTADMPWKTAEQMLQVNIGAMVQLTLLFLPEMQKRNAGHIINISSIAGKMPNQGISMYGATKSFMDSFTTSLFRELKGTHVHVSVVRPGPVTTEFFDRAQKVSNGLRTPGEGSAVPVSKVADAIWRLIRHPHKVSYVPGILSFSPWLEILFGWLIDQLGPLLLKKSAPKLIVVPISLKSRNQAISKLQS
jgi:short-subunit dehydrogenase